MSTRRARERAVEKKVKEAFKREAVEILPLKPKSTKELNKILKAARRNERNQ